MKKNFSLYYDDEINLSVLFKIIWDGKIKILLITIISILVGFVHNSQLPINYLNSLNIYPSKEINNLTFGNIEQLKKLNETNLVSTNDFIFDLFINELTDYEEFILSLKNTKKIKESILELKIEDQDKELFKYASLLELEKSKKNPNSYIIYFKWPDPEEARILFQETLNLVSINLRKKINLDLLQNLDFQKKISLNKDRSRLDFLKEQSAIAKELNIINNEIDNFNLSQSSVSLNINTANFAYYLRGYKAIDKEIELIQNRDYQNIKFLEQELELFMKKKIELANYNIYTMKTELIDNKKINLVILTLLGLIVGVFFVLILNALQLRKSKKN